MVKAPTKAELQQLRLKKEQVAAKKKELVEGLPFLYGHKWYEWQRSFFQTTNRMALLTAANQIGKSTVLQWRHIHRNTCPKLWPELWPKSPRPKQVWYLYPDQAIVNNEFRLKWMDWMPRGRFKDDPVFGWKLEASRNEREIHGIRWNTGVETHFKTYSQDVHSLQAGTVWAIDCDEELPEELWDELDQRLSDPEGHFASVFTATRNQVMWKRAMEGVGEAELFPDAWKRQVSKYDCLVFDDGTPGRYTREQVEAQEKRCRTRNEALRRIYGKFVTEEGLKFPAFAAEKHVISHRRLPDGWKIYGGVDIGSGGGSGHPAAIVFVAVSPDHRLGYVFKVWRGDDVQTTAGDVLDIYLKLRGSMPVVQAAYDWQAKDFSIISTRAGEPFIKAEKGHDIGESTVNTLFKGGMLYILDDDEEAEKKEAQKLITELSMLMKDTPKTRAKDDLCDALRYCVTQIPWDWSALVGAPSDDEIAEKNKDRPLTEKELLALEIEERRGAFKRKEPEGWSELTDEFDFWNDLYGNN